jgi:parallel beta-helix repeat protein
MNVLATLGILSVSLREGGCGGKESSNAAQRHRSGCFRVSRRSRSSIRLGLVSASFNKVCGIEVFGQCQPLLEANTCQGNKWHGIAYGGSAGGTAQNNSFSANEFSGIDVLDQAQPTLQAITCKENQQSGIYVGGQAQPTLDANSCRKNTRDGIAFRGQAGGIALGNERSDNGEDGFCVTAFPTLTDNRCQGNKGKDIKDYRRSFWQGLFGR